MTDICSMFRAWWRDRGDYRWLIETLESRSALRPLRLMIGSGGVGMVLITMLTLKSDAGQQGPVGHTQAIAGAAVAGVWTVRWWLLPWPREAESLAWVAVMDIGITANNVMVQDRLLGALGVVMLVPAGGYVTIFHGPRVLATHFGWSLLSVVLMAALLVTGGPAHTGHGARNFALAASVVVADLVVTCVVLPTVQFCHWLLRLDALSDPLTKLLNRRGLDSQLARFVGRGVNDDVYVVALDLDRFKSVNDTFGHAFGDEVLVQTAECLRAAAQPDATVARTGGEEFAIVGYLQGAAIDVLTERLRSAIETMPGLPITITASVGAAMCAPTGPGFQHLGPRPRTLFHRADSAMYQAKQLGGNTVVIAEDTTQATATAPTSQIRQPCV
ncbi:GGDEF domain-containing protein [Nocardia suismassiliense]|uniref:GGDEF domain-containing protein n=1 Tax=Nocardia suismassiliense TaxID=2077092 RepID=UPI000D1D6A45|nr:GGDEF domain-containing protein [Nocardia suismassiliense]